MNLLEQFLFIWTSGFFVLVGTSGFLRFSSFRLNSTGWLAKLIVCLIAGRFFLWIIYPNLGLLWVGAILTGLLLGISLDVNHQKSPVDAQGFSNWLYLVLLSAILVVAFILRFYRLELGNILVDEMWQFKSAVGYLKTGEFRFWDFFYQRAGNLYRRAWLYTWQVARLLKIGGVSLFTARLVSIFWGLLLFLPLYWLAKELGLSRLRILLVFFLAAISPYFITISRWVRFYSMFTVCYTGLIVSSWRLLQFRERKEFFSWGSISLLLLVISLHLNYLTLLFPIALAGWYVTRPEFWHNGFKNRQIFIFIGIVIIFLCAVIIALMWMPAEKWSEVGQWKFQNVFYGFALTREIFSWFLGGAFFGYAIIWFWRRNSVSRYCLWMLVLPLGCLLFSSRSIPQVRYAGFLFPLWLLVAVPAVFNLGHEVFHRHNILKKLFVIVVLIGFPTYRFAGNLSLVWQGHNGFVASPQDKSTPYRKVAGRLLKILDKQKHIFVLDFPSYVAVNFKNSQHRVYFRSTFEERVRKEYLNHLRQKPGKLLVLKSTVYRKPFSRSARRVFRKNFKQLSCPPDLQGRGIKLFIEKKQ